MAWRLLWVALAAPAAADPLTTSAAPAAAAVVAVPGGQFFLGRRPTDAGGESGHEVTVAPFAIDRTEVTVEQYAACVAAGVCKAVPARQRRCNSNRGASFRAHPVNCVTWGQADAFCRWRGAALPTTEQWERAARGSDERRYPWGNEPPGRQLCWQREPKGAATTCPVGSHPAGASPCGALDLAGNVAEWTATRVKQSFEVAYLIRGGGFAVEDLAMAEPDDLDFRADRDSGRPATAAAMDLGFRCAVTVVATAAQAVSPAPDTGAAGRLAFTPSPGTAERKRILDTLRAALKVTAEFKVEHLKVVDEWAYFEGHPVTGKLAEGKSLRALLARAADGQWSLVASAPPAEPSAATLDAKLAALAPDVQKMLTAR